MENKTSDVRVTDPTGIVAARNLNRFRLAQGKTLKEVVRIVELEGTDLSELALGRIERQQQRLELGKLTALAYALNVSVCDILTPTAVDKDLVPMVTGLPTFLEYTPEEIAAWFKGETAINPESLAAWHEKARQKLIRNIDRDEQAIATMEEQNIPAEYIDVARDNLSDSVKRLADIEDRIKTLHDLEFLT